MAERLGRGISKEGVKRNFLSGFFYIFSLGKLKPSKALLLVIFLFPIKQTHTDTQTHTLQLLIIGTDEDHTSSNC